MPFGYSYGYGFGFSTLSLSAFIALNGDLATDVNGDRYLVNSKGDDVLSTTNQSLTFNGSTDGIEISETSEDAQTIIFNLDYTEVQTGTIFETGTTYASSFEIYSDSSSISIYYSADGVASATHHTHLISGNITNAEKNRWGVTVSASEVKLYRNGLLVETFEGAKKGIQGTASTYFMSSKTPNLFVAGTGDNLQVWSTLFDEVDMLNNTNNEEDALIDSLTNPNCMFSLPLFEGTGTPQSYSSGIAQNVILHGFSTIEDSWQSAKGGSIGAQRIRIGDTIPPHVPDEDEYPTPTGTVYYFDAVNGLDTNDGLTEGTAKQTLAGAESISTSGGDHILFKRGDTFVGSIYRAYMLGDVGNPIVWGAYGIGANPIITSVTDHNYTFTDNLDGTWKTTEATSILRLEEDGTEIVRSSTLDTLGDDGVWFWNDATDELHIVAGSDPSLNNYGWSEAARTFLLYLTSHYQIRDIDIEGGYLTSVSVLGNTDFNFFDCNIGRLGYVGASNSDWGGTNSEDITYTRCNIDSQYPEALTGVIDSADATRGAQDGFVTANCSNVTLVDSSTKNWHHTQISEGGVDNNYKNLDITSNGSYGAPITTQVSSDGAEMSLIKIHDMHERSQFFGKRTHFHHSIIKDISASPIKSHTTGQGLWLQGGSGTVQENIFENLIIANCENEAIGLFSGTLGIQDNIFRNINAYNCGISDNGLQVKVYPNDDLSLLSGNKWYNSNFYTTLGAKFSYKDGLTMTLTEFEASALDLNNEAYDNLESDPLFNNQVEFKLENGSPSTGTGVLPLATVDYNETTITKESDGSGYDIGIYNQVEEVVIANNTMHISIDYNQIIAVVPTEAYTVKWTTSNGTTYELSTFTTNIDTNQMLAHMGVSDAEVKSIEIFNG